MWKLWLVAAVLVGCGGSLEINAPDEEDVWYGEADVKAARPDGKQIGIIGSDSQVRQRRNRFAYHGGPVMLGTTNVYLIWYGTWPNPAQKVILTDLVSNLGGSAYFGVNATYTDGTGNAVSNAVQYAGSIDDATYSQGFTLSDMAINAVVTSAIAGAQLPSDPNGVYFVLASSDVNATSGLCTSYCGMHQVTSLDAVTIKYAFIGDPSRCPAACQPQATGPNGDAAMDAMASLVAAELSNTVTDPQLSSWYDRRGFEPADKCAWTYGQTYTTGNGAVANVHLGARDYLLQQLWRRTATGEYCSLGN